MINDLKTKNMFGIVFSDLLIQMLIIIMFIFTIEALIPKGTHIEDKNKQVGVLCVELSWPDRDIDLDLWSNSPGENETVGWSNMHSPNLDLLRDIIGFHNNPTHIMLEMVCAKKMVPGEWTFNVHYFANHEHMPPLASHDPSNGIKATMILSIKKPGNADQIYMAKYNLTYDGQEKTMFNFIVNNAGDIIESSMNTVDKKLSSGITNGGGN